MTTMRRVAAIGVLVLAACTVTASAQPTAADSTTVTVTPGEVSDGQAVTITTSGFPSAAIYGFFQCRPAIIGLSDFDVWNHCRVLGGLQGGQPPTAYATTLVRRFSVSNGTVVDCATEPGGCVVGLTMVTAGGAYLQEWASVTFGPGLETTPDRGLSDGDRVGISVPDVPDGAWTVAQCRVDELTSPDPAQRDARCGPAVALTVDARTATGELIVHAPLVTVDGTTVPCGYGDCALVVTSPDDPLRTGHALSFGPPSISFPAPVRQGEQYEVALAGLPGETAIVRQCGGAAGPSTCDAGAAVTLDRLGTGRLARTSSSTFTSVDGNVVDCGISPCSLVAEVDDEVVASAAIEFIPVTTISVSPADGLLDGQTVTVSVTGLAPDSTFDVYRCIEPWVPTCEPVATGTSSPAGDLVVPTMVDHRMGATGRCRDQCAFAVHDGFEWRFAPYALATGAVAVVPDTGLTDGQQVHVTATDLMPTYVGPSYGPFPTGGWFGLQCAPDTAWGLTLFSALARCGAPVPVTVTGSTAGFDITVQRSLTTNLGRTFDCASPEACGVGLYRFESDGTSTLWTSPIQISD